VGLGIARNEVKPTSLPIDEPGCIHASAAWCAGRPGGCRGIHDGAIVGRVEIATKDEFAAGFDGYMNGWSVEANGKSRGRHGVSAYDGSVSEGEPFPRFREAWRAREIRLPRRWCLDGNENAQADRHLVEIQVLVMIPRPCEGFALVR